MRKARIPDTARASIIYTHTDEDRTLTFDIVGYVSRYRPATWESPAEGGCMEDWELSLIDATFIDGRTFGDLTPEEIKALEAEFSKRIVDSLYDTISELVYEAVNQDYEYCDRD